MEILNGKEFAEIIKSQVRANVEQFSLYNNAPCLACIIVEGNPASEIYIANKEKACKSCGIKSLVVRLPQDVSQEELELTIEKLNRNREVNSILLQLPLPAHLDESKALGKISPIKDADCLTKSNLGYLFAGESDYAPCTSTGIIKLLKHYGIKISGKNAVVVGRSLLVGKSVACLLEQNNATVTLCHSKTENLQDITSRADILVVAMGKANFITSQYVKPGAVVVDVGINRIDGKIYGDVNFEDVKNKCSYITPVPGGVGPLTVACLMENTLTLAEVQQKENLKGYNS